MIKVDPSCTASTISNAQKQKAKVNTVNSPTFSSRGDFGKDRRRHRTISECSENVVSFPRGVCLRLPALVRLHQQFRPTSTEVENRRFESSNDIVSDRCRRYQLPWNSVLAPRSTSECSHEKVTRKPRPVTGPWGNFR